MPIMPSLPALWVRMDQMWIARWRSNEIEASERASVPRRGHEAAPGSGLGLRDGKVRLLVPGSVDDRARS